MLFGKIGYLELTIIVFILLIIFGPGRLPQLTKSIGKSIKGYREGMSGKDEIKEGEEEEKKE